MRPTAEPDSVSLTAGLVLVVFGIVLLLDRSGALTLDFGVVAPIALGAIGAILLATGLARGRGER